jgi:hypothetical protein
MSEASILNTYRSLLDSNGYADKPIFITEAGSNMPFQEVDKQNWNWVDDDEVAILLMERFVLSLSNKENNGVIGLMLGEVMSSYNRGLCNYNEGLDQFEKTNKFYFYQILLKFIRKYNYHSKHIAGELNSSDHWIEEFKDNSGNNMWMAFCPFLFEAGTIYSENKKGLSAIATNKIIHSPQTVILDVGDIKSVKISTLYNTIIVNAENGKVSFSLGKEPAFIEEIR